MAVPAGIMAAGLALDAIGLGLSSHGQHKANRTNLKIAREGWAWEERMSNSAVQRRARDIEMAGGNRALAFTGGQEASTPNISTPTMQNEYAGADAILANAAPKAMALLTAKQGLAQSRAQTQLIQQQAKNAAAQAQNIRADTYLKLSTAQKQGQDIEHSKQAIENMKQQLRNMGLEESARNLELEIRRKSKEDVLLGIKNEAHAKGLVGKLEASDKFWRDANDWFWGNDPDIGRKEIRRAPWFQKQLDDRRKGKIKR